MYRLTEQDDMTTLHGRTIIEKILTHPAAKAGRIVLWSAIPCTGGSAWNRRNWLKGTWSTRTRIENHWRVFHDRWKTFEWAAEKIENYNGAVVIEWPSGCVYWKNQAVNDFILGKEMFTSIFDGCKYNLLTSDKRSIDNPNVTDKDGHFVLIKKTWKIAFSKNAFQFGKYLDKRCGNGPLLESPHSHAECSGKETKLTEKYTWEIAKSVHSAFTEFCESKSREGRTRSVIAC